MNDKSLKGSKRLLAVAVLGVAPFALVAAPAANADEIKTGLKGAPTFQSTDGDFRFMLRGRIHFDTAFYDEDDVPMNDGFLFRRTRMGMDGQVHKDWRFRVEYDFAENGTAANDVRVQYRGWDFATLTMGQFKMPFSLEELTSSNNVTFMERALPNEFATARKIGFALNGSVDDFGWTAAVYGRSIGQTVVGDQPLNLGARVTWGPQIGDNQRLHLGLAYAREETDDANSMRIRQRPESRVDGARLVDTGDLAGVTDIDKLGVEAAWIAGPLSLQGEYMTAKLTRDGAEDPTMDGYYVQAAYTLTGESRGYSGGAMSGIRPSGPGGAWEVAARYSNINLNDSGVTGGEMSNITLGVNWYANSNVRFMGNVIFVDTDDSNPSRTDDPTIYQARVQFVF